MSYRIAAPFLALLWFTLTGPVLAFELPDCGPLEKWAATLEPGETFALREAVSVTTLLREERVVPLVGAPVDTWSRQDVAALRRQLGNCRSAASREREAVARQLYDAVKALDGARRDLVRIEQERSRAASTVERLLGRSGDPRLAGQIALTEDAFRGRPVDPDRHGLQRVPNWIRHVERARPYLTEVEVDELVSRLEERRVALEAEADRLAGEREAILAALRGKLAAVPATEAGLRRLAELEREPRLRTLPAETVRAFRGEVQRRRQTVVAAVQAERQRQYQAERAREAEARAARERAARLRAERERERQRSPSTGRPEGRTQARTPQASAGGGAVERLARVVSGDRLGGLALAGLTPGVPERDALDHLRQRLGYEETMSPFFTRAWGRGNAFVELRSMDDAIGQLDYTEYARVELDFPAVEAALVERFGPPDSAEALRGSGRLMTWRGEGQSLQVFATDVLHPAVRHQGFRGRISISLWGAAYDAHLAAVNGRCAELRDRARNQWSMNDSHYFGVNCPNMPGATKRPGVQVVE